MEAHHHQVTHYYSIVDQDGIELLPEAERKLVISPTGDNFYATAGYTVSPEYKNDSFTVDTTPSGGGGDSDSDSYHVTVQYKKLGSNETLAENYRSANIRSGRDYDVSAEATLTISGYAIDHVEGKTAGTIRGNVVVTVWYTVDDTKEPGNPDVDPVTPPEEEIVDEDVPLTDLPGVDRPDADRPLPPETGEIIIVDDGIPMGNLPQTGTTRGGGNAAATLLGLGGLVSALGAGMLLKGKRKEEN